ncbi:MAG: hypothetical protein ACTSRP_03370 [Candidatus Helarchaeota archaeon]
MSPIQEEEKKRKKEEKTKKEMEKYIEREAKEKESETAEKVQIKFLELLKADLNTLLNIPDKDFEINKRIEELKQKIKEYSKPKSNSSKVKTEIEELEEKFFTLEEVSQAREEETSEVKKKDILTEDEKLILSVLDFVDKHKSGLTITGFQIKDFLEQIFPEKDVDNLYFQLKEKELIDRRRDSEEFYLSFKGKEEAKKQGSLLKSVFFKVGDKLEEFLEKNELLKRILYFSCIDNWRFRNFLPRIANILDETERVLTTFFTDDSFLEIPVVSRAIRIIRKEQPSQIKEILIDYCEDIDFLKALAILRLGELAEKIGIETIGTLYYKPYTDTLSEITEEAKVKDVLEKLLLLGITETENLFEIDIESVLMKEENISKIKEWLSFDANAFKNRLENDWNLFINVKNVLERTTPFDFEDLISTKAVIHYKDSILVRKEVEHTFWEIYEKIKEKIKNKVKGIENAIVIPFYDISYEELKELRGKFIIVLHAYDWWSKKHYNPAFRADVLENNVILLISPREIGFKLDEKKIRSEKKNVLELPDKNIEFNAIGEMDNLERVKSIFNVCEWILEEEYDPVKKAKELIWERKNPPISMEDAINELKNGMEGIDGKILIDALLISMNPPVNYTAVFINREFTKYNLWQLIEKILKLKYGIEREQFLRVKEILERIIEEKVRIDLLTLGLSSRPGSQEYYDLLNSMQETIYQKSDIQSRIHSSIEKLNKKSQEILWIYLSYFVNSDLNINFDRFNKLYESIFGKNLGIIDDVVATINKSGISIANKISEDYFNEKPFSFIIKYNQISDLLKILEKYIQIEKSQITHFIEKYKNNAFELIGLDFLLQSNGFCYKSSLREFLLKISPYAWNKFESYERVITLKDDEYIAINPLILDELRKFMSDYKKEMIKSGGNIFSGNHRFINRDR